MRNTTMFRPGDGKRTCAACGWLRFGWESLPSWPALCRSCGERMARARRFGERMADQIAPDAGRKP